MALASFTLREDYWQSFKVESGDIENLYNHLLECETPLTTAELVKVLVQGRVAREIASIEKNRSAGGAVFLPKESYTLEQQIVFPALGWRQGTVVGIRPGVNPDLGDFQVIQVAFADNDVREFAANLPEHTLNNPTETLQDQENLNTEQILAQYGEDLEVSLEEELEHSPDFVRIAGRWFPRALLVDINVGHLNLAEAILDMAGGGPATTAELLEQIGLADSENNLTEFSLALALQEDPRFDEVGPAGQILWHLNRLEPEGVLKMPSFLRYDEIEYDRTLLTEEMLALERQLDDELSPVSGKFQGLDEVQIPLIFPHWRAGTLPLSARVRHLFPTAYEAPRIRFMLVDGDSGEKFPGWVVRTNRYVFGLRNWYLSKNLMPGGVVRIRKGAAPGEVIVRCETHRPTREWVRTVLVGSDGGVVFADLKQNIHTAYDERMTVVVPDPEALDMVWSNPQKDRSPFERALVNIVRELSRLNPQSHVHALELYAALNIVRRCPPGPILAMLISRPWFVHVGDLYFRFDDSETSNRI